MKHLTPSVAAVVLGSLCCCSPVYTVSRYGVKARLIDSVTRQPVKHAEAQVVIDGDAFPSKTGGDGSVAVRPDLDWHLSWLGGPAWMGRRGAEIALEATGYRGKRIRWAAHRPAGDSAFREDRGVIDLGAVEMEKR